MSFNIEVQGGSSVRLPTAGKYCDRDIVVTATSGGSGTTNIQTCTVRFDNESLSADCDILAIVASVFENGEFNTHGAFASDLINRDGFGPSATLSNVVCGTKIYLIASIPYYTSVGAYVEIDGSAALESERSISTTYDRALLTFNAPSVAGEECTIYFAYNA